MTGSGTSIICRVRWKALWASLSKFISIAISVPVIVLMGIRFISSGLDVDKTFEHVSPAESGLILIGIVAFAIVFSFLIAVLFKMASIEVANGVISGRNFWGLKKHIPLTDIVRIYPFSNNGINATVVASKSHGEVYIYEHTEHLPELLDFLISFMPADPHSIEPGMRA